jgi:hypothetical protein
MTMPNPESVPTQGPAPTTEAVGPVTDLLIAPQQRQPGRLHGAIAFIGDFADSDEEIAALFLGQP